MKFEIDNPEIISRMIVSMTVSQNLQEVKLLRDLSLNTEDWIVFILFVYKFIIVFSLLSNSIRKKGPWHSIH